eukprot:tig00021038_g17557.t1
MTSPISRPLTDLRVNYLAVLATVLRDPRHFDRALRAKYGDCFAFTLHLGLTSKKFVVLSGPEGSKFFHYAQPLCFRTGFGESVGALMPPRLFDRDRVAFVNRALASNKYPGFVEIIHDEMRAVLAKMPDEGTGEDIFTFLAEPVFRMQVRMLYGDMLRYPGMYERFRVAFGVLDPGPKFGSFLGSLRHLAGFNTERDQKARDVIVQIAKTLIEERLKEPADSCDDDPVRKGDLVGLAAKDPEVRNPDGSLNEDELFAFFWGNLFAAVGNSFFAIGWIAYRLTHDKAARERLLGEWRGAVRAAGGVTLEAVNRVEFGNMLVNEVIRTSTPGFSFRRATADCTYQDKYRIPQGRLLAFLWNSCARGTGAAKGGTARAVQRAPLSPPGINQNEEIFSRPSAFEPARWATEAKEPGSSIVFGAGRHPCPGAKLTYIEFKVRGAAALPVDPRRSQRPAAAQGPTSLHYALRRRAGAFPSSPHQSLAGLINLRYLSSPAKRSPSLA